MPHNRIAVPEQLVAATLILELVLEHDEQSTSLVRVRLLYEQVWLALIERRINFPKAIVRFNCSGERGAHTMPSAQSVNSSATALQ